MARANGEPSSPDATALTSILQPLGLELGDINGQLAFPSYAAVGGLPNGLAVIVRFRGDGYWATCMATSCSPQAWPSAASVCFAAAMVLAALERKQYWGRDGRLLAPTGIGAEVLIHGDPPHDWTRIEDPCPPATPKPSRCWLRRAWNQLRGVEAT